MNEDFSEAISKLKGILNEKNIDISSFTNNINNNNNNINYDANRDNSSDNLNHSNNIINNNENNRSDAFDFDIETIFKIKNLISSAMEKNSPRIKLLEALKPFLKYEKQEKLEEYIKIANMLTILEILRENRR